MKNLAGKRDNPGVRRNLVIVRFHKLLYTKVDQLQEFRLTPATETFRMKYSGKGTTPGRIQVLLVNETLGF